MRRRPWRYGLGLALFLALGLELACRVGLIPNAAHELGRRAREGGAHVLILGDSFSVEDAGATLGNQLRQRFSARGAAVVNLSVQGYGPADELDALRLFNQDNPGYRPDLVMVNYFVGNDLTDTLFRLKGGLSRVGLLRVRGGQWLQRSYLLRLLGGWLQQRQANADAERIRRTRMLLLPPLPAAKQALNPYLVDLAHVLPDFLTINLLMEGAPAQLSWQENQRILRRIHAYAGNAKMIINILPQTLQVNDSHYSFFKELGFRVEPRMLGSTEPQDRMKAFCAQEGMICNDLLPGFKTGQEYYLPADDHWLTSGHTLAAELIAGQALPLLPR